MADVLSSCTWKETVAGEIKGRKAWKAKYGHQFEMEDSQAPTPAGSRPGTGMSMHSQSQGGSRPATGMSMASTQSKQDQRKKLQDLKKKLTAALNEVEDELQATGSVR